MLTLKQLEAFVAVATMTSFSRAAAHLNSSQTAISSRIAQLENYLAVRLFERDTGTVSLTTRGRDLLGYAESVLRGVNRLNDRAGATDRLVGLLRLGATETIVHTWLPPLLEGLNQSCPAVDIEVIVGVTETLKSQLRERHLDLAFLQGPFSDAQLHNIDLSTFPMTWAAAPGLVGSRIGRLSADEMSKFRILAHGRNTKTFNEIKRYFDQEISVPIRLVPTTSIAACLRMAMSGLGIASLPYAVAREEIRQGCLVEIEADWLPSDLQTSVVFQIDQVNPIVDLVVQAATRVVEGFVARA